MLKVASEHVYHLVTARFNERPGKPHPSQLSSLQNIRILLPQFFVANLSNQSLAKLSS